MPRLDARNRTPFQCFAALALIGVFVVENPHCGSSPYDHRQLAFHYLERGQFDRALKSARRALREHPDQVGNHLIVAHALLGKGQVEDALSILHQATTLHPDNDRLYAAIREICTDKERFDLAEQTYADLLSAHPDNARARAGLGWARARLGKLEEAINLLEEAAQADSSDAAFAHIQLGQLYREQQQFQLAITALERGLSRTPDHPQLLLELGSAHAQNSQWDQAESRFDQALALAGDQTDPLLGTSQRLDWTGRIALVYSNLERFDLAIPYYEIIVEKGDPSPVALNNLAWAYSQENTRLDYALELALSAVKRQPHRSDYLDTFAEVYFRLGSPRRAIALINRALAVEPEDGQHRQYLLEQLQRFNAALRL